MKPYITKINSARIFGLLFAITLSLVCRTAQAGGTEVWTDQDIGNVGVTGTSSYNSALDTLTVQGAGIGAGGASDNLHFVYLPMTGNAEIIVQVSSLSSGIGDATGGIMFRETLDPAATNSMISTSAFDEVSFESRLTTGSTSGTVFGPYFGTPVWLRLVRSGSTFAGYESTDGFNWTLTGSSTIAMANNYYAGIAVSSGVVASLSTGVFSNVSVLTNVPQPSANMLLWLRADVDITINYEYIPDMYVWFDQSGNFNSPISILVENDPTLVSGAINGLNAVNFNGSTAYLQFDDTVGYVPNVGTGFSDFTKGLSIIAVAKPTSAALDASFVDLSTSYLQNEIILARSGTTSNFELQITSGTTSTVTSNGGLALNQYQLLEAIQTGSSGVPANAVTLYRNGILVGSGKSSAIPKISRPNSYLGVSSNVATGFYAGDLAELFIFNRNLTNSERQDMEAYIFQKYGVGTQPVEASPTSSIPSGVYGTPQTVTLSSSGAAIYYTTDGSIPTTASTLYTGPFIVSQQSTTINAIAVNTGYANSAPTQIVIKIEPTVNGLPFGLTMWLRADSISATNGSPITQWMDSSGNGNDAVQTATSNRPTYLSNGINGLPVVHFTGSSSQFFTLPNMLSTAASAQILIVLREPNMTSANGLWVFGANTSGDYYTYTNGDIYDAFGTSVRKAAGSPGKDLTQFRVYEASSAPSLWQDWVDGVPLLSTSANIVAFSEAPRLGKNIQNKYFTGDVAEVMLFDRALSAADRQSLEAYIYNIYGVGTQPLTPAPTINVPTGIYAGAQSVTLSDSVGAIIYYTTDGSTPTTSSTTYTTPIPVLTSATIQAIAQQPLYAPSAVVSSTITIDAATSNVAQDGLTMWLRADSLSGSNGSPIAFWPDVSGNGNNATQTGLGMQPTYQSNVLDGKPVVQFTGFLSQFFKLPNMLSNAASGQILIVLNEPNTTSANGLWLFGTNSGGDYYTYTNGEIYDGFGASVRKSAGLPGVDVTKFSVYEASSAASLWEDWIDGTPLLTTTANIVAFSKTPLLGRNAQNAYFTGNVAEVLLYNRTLSTTERQNLEAYIYQRYGAGTQPATPAPTISVPTGLYSGMQSVTLNDSVGAIIYYTTDGSTPTTSSTTYTTPITVLTSATIQAIAQQPLYAPSVVVSSTITIDAATSNVAQDGLTMWLRADSLSGPNGTPVALWPDESGNGNNATQTGLGNQPTYQSDVLNGLPVVQFTGFLSQFFKLPNMLSNAPAGQILIVLKEPNTTSANGLWEFGTSSSAGDYYTYTTGGIYDGFGASVRKSVGLPGVDVTQFNVYEASSAASLWEDWIDGAPLLTTTANIVAFSKTPLLGRNVQNAYFTGEVAEVLLYDRALSTTERQNLEAYIYQRYGVGTQPATPAPTISVPTGLYSGAQSVTLSDSVGAIIYYTTDGSTPTTSSTTYTTPLTVLTSATIQAIAQQPSYAPSAVVSSTITIDTATSNVALDGLTMWLRADSLSGPNGTPVALWPDESGNGNNATQTGLGNQPTFLPNTLNGLPVVQFTGFLSQYFTLPNMLSNATAGQILIVLREPNTTSANGLWEFGTSSAAGDYYTYTNAGIYDGFGASVRKSVGLPGVDVTHFNVYEASSAASLWEDWIDGAPLLTTTANIVAFSKTPLLGRNVQNAYFTGEVAEVLLYNRALTSSERQNLEAYIYNRYGVGTQPATPAPTISVPTGLYSGTQSVTLSDSAGAIIYYTTDGSTPTTSSTTYSAPITVSTSSTIQAIAQQPSYAPSAVVSSTITIDTTITNVSRDGLTMWLRADSISGTNGTPVALWPDYSGNGNNATQTGLGNQPTYLPNTLNGLPVVQFTGSSSQYFTLPNMLSTAAAGQILIVLREPNTTAANGLWVFGGNSSGDFYTYTNGYIYDDFGSKTRQTVGLPGVDARQFNVYEVSSSPSLWEAWMDGTPLLATNPNTVSFIATPRLGKNAQNYYFTGDVAEVLLYNRALSTAERQALEAYIYQRYGVGTP